MKKKTKIGLALLLAALCLAGCGSNPVTEAAMEASAARTAETAAPDRDEAVDAAALTEENETETAASAESQTAETELPYDLEAYQAAETALAQEYQIVSITEPGEFREEEHPEIPWYSVVAYLYERFDLGLYGGHYDFDGNGVPELVVAMGDGENNTPIGVYAFDGQTFRYLGKEQPLGERSRLGLNGEGDFVVSASGGASVGAVLVYRIAEDGFSTEVLSHYEYEYRDDGSVAITNLAGSMTPEDFDPEQFLLPFDVPIDYEKIQ